MLLSEHQQIGKFNERQEAQVVFQSQLVRRGGCIPQAVTHSSMSVPCCPTLDVHFRQTSGLLDVNHYVRSFLGCFMVDHQEINEFSREDCLLMPVHREAWKIIISSLDSFSLSLKNQVDPFSGQQHLQILLIICDPALCSSHT